MPPEWLRIRQARSDVTDYLIHWTRSTTDANGTLISAYDVLKSIIKCGYLIPSFAPKKRVTVGDRKNTIQGPNPAVCFTEQPLHSFVQSCDVLPSRYQPYAVALRKDRLFVYGGRPVVYGDENLLAALPDDWKYLWVRYNPIPVVELGGYPIDWTHEREWRARATKYLYASGGTSPEEGIPLLLPPRMAVPKPVWYLPWILVRNGTEVDAFHQFISGLPKYTGTSKILDLYFKLLKKAPVISIDDIETKMKNKDDRWSRLDTLPLEEIDKTARKIYNSLGWRYFK
jgi:hypothetical protein